MTLLGPALVLPEWAVVGVVVKICALRGPSGSSSAPEKPESSLEGERSAYGGGDTCPRWR